MKPAELGNFLDEKLLTKGFELFHDPNMGKEVSAARGRGVRGPGVGEGHPLPLTPRTLGGGG